MIPNLSGEPSSPLSDFEKYADKKSIKHSPSNITDNICSNLTDKKFVFQSKINLQDTVKNSFNDDKIDHSQFKPSYNVFPSATDEKDNKFQDSKSDDVFLRLTAEKSDNHPQEKLPYNDCSNLIDLKTNIQLQNVTPDIDRTNLNAEKEINHTQDTMPYSTCSNSKENTSINQHQNNLSDKASSSLIDKINLNQTPSSIPDSVFSKLTEDAYQPQDNLPNKACDNFTDETNTLQTQVNISDNLIPGSKYDKNFKQLQDSTPDSKLISPSDEKNSIQLQDDTLNNTRTDLPGGKNKVVRANKLLLPVMPPAEDFVYSPETYNEEYLLKEYPQTFKSPVKVDVLTLTSEELIETIEKICVSQGEPLVIQNFHKLEGFDAETFSLGWLKKAYNEKEVRVRDLILKKDVSLSFNEFLSSVEDVPYSDIRYYGKDIECPAEWEAASKKFLPPYLQYMGPTDLNGLLDDRLKIDNLMIYVGHEGTHTATHFDMCGSVGHNLMVQADEGCSALWFMVAQNNANEARKFWHNYGGGNTTIDQDNCILPAHIMGQAGFPIYAFEQKLGDFVIVPSETPHQVVNIGKGCTIKFSWNRNTATSLSHCINSVLLVNRRILKMETYRTKTMVEQGVIQWGKILEESNLSDFFVKDRERFCRDYRILLQLYTNIIASDVIDTSYKPITQQAPKISTDSYPHSRVCDFCRCDIWNNWFHCERCPINKKLGIYGHDLCVDCFAENRKCLNYQELEWFCHRPIKRCIKDLVKFSKLFNDSPVFLGLSSHKPVPILSDLKSFEELHPGVYSPITLAVKINDHYKIAGHRTCHQCAISRFYSDMVVCTTCVRSFCCGCISNRYALNPFELAREKGWQCFYCIKKCNCAKCARKFGEENVIPLPPNPFCLKDFYDNYYLGYGLTYFPVGESKILIPNVVDFQTFLGRKKGMDKATDPKVIANLIPYTGPIDNSTLSDIHVDDINFKKSAKSSEEGNANKSKNKRKSADEEAPKRRSKKTKAVSEIDVSSKDNFETTEDSTLRINKKKARSRNQIDSDEISENIKENPVLTDILSDIKPPRKRGRPRKTPLPPTECPNNTDFTTSPEKAVLTGEDNNALENQSEVDTEQTSLKDTLIESNDNSVEVQSATLDNSEHNLS